MSSSWLHRRVSAPVLGAFTAAGVLSALTTVPPAAATPATGAQQIIIQGGSYSSAVMAMNPVVYYRLGDPGLPTGSNTAVASDHTGTTNGTYPAGGGDRSVSGAIVGDPDTAVQGDGTGPVMYASAQSLPSGSAIRSVEMWVKFPAADAGRTEPLFQYGTPRTGSGTGQELTVTVSGAQGQTFTAYADNQKVATWTSGAGIFDGAWHHLGFVYDQNGNLTAGQDERYLGSDPVSLNTGSTNAVLALGTSDGDGVTTPDTYANGAFDEVAVYAHTLDPYSFYSNTAASGLPPAGPANVSATAGPQSLKVTWAPSPSATRYALEAYSEHGHAYAGVATVTAADACSGTVCRATVSGLATSQNPYGVLVYGANSYGVGFDGYYNGTSDGGVAVQPGTGGYVDTVLGDHPAAYYRLDEPVSIVGATDSAPNTTGQDRGIFLDSNVILETPGALGGDTDPAVTATGTGPVMSAPADHLPAGSASRSVEMWFKFPVTDAGSARSLFQYGTKGGSEFALNVSSTGKAFEVSKGASLLARFNSSSSSVYDGKWHQLTVTYNGSATSPSMSVYLDGAPVSPPGPLAIDTGTTGSTFEVGSSDGYANFADGSFDEVAVYPTALTAGQVAAHFAAAQYTPLPPPNPPPAPAPTGPASAPPPPGVNPNDVTPGQTRTVGSGAPTSLSGSAGGTSGQVTVQPGALPDGTAVTEFLVNPASFRSPAGYQLVNGYAVSWQTPSGTAPDASTPIVLTIKAAPGDTIFLVNPDGTLQAAGTAGPDGTATVSFTKDPAFLVAEPAPAPPAPPAGPQGYRLFGADGGVFDFGTASYHGSLAGRPLPAPITGSAPTPDGGGYWLVGADGTVYPFGDAKSFGSLAGRRLSAPIVGMAASPDGGGYWLVASDGGIFSFGDAGFFGSTGDIQLNRPIVGMAASPDGGGYWLVASDGGIFSFGDAGFHGSTGSIRLNRPIVGMAAPPDGGGYWLVASDGGIFSFGDARFHGSTGNIHLNQPITGLVCTGSGAGYWLIARDGGVFSFGDAGYQGSAGGVRLAAPVVTATGA